MNGILETPDYQKHCFSETNNEINERKKTNFSPQKDTAVQTGTLIHYATFFFMYFSTLYCLWQTLVQGITHTLLLSVADSHITGTLLQIL